MIRVVIDTNVLVASVISPAGPNAQVLELVLAGSIRPYVTKALAEEYSRVFEYERLKHLNRRKVASVLHLFQRGAITVKSRGRLKLSNHDEDNQVYECALAAKAHYIVTENKQHFPQSHKYTKIVNARQLLKLLRAE